MRDPIRILELRSVWGTGGGPEKTILFGTECATRARFAVTVCYIRDQRDQVFGIDKRAGALDIDYVEVRERHSFDPSVWGALKSLVRDRRIDIVHSHDYKTSLLAYLLSRRTGIIPLATAHGWTGQTARERFVYYPFDKRLLSRFPRVIAVSNEIKEELVRHGAQPDRVSVILNGIHPDAFRRCPEQTPAVRAALAVAPDDIVIGAVGRLEQQKRFDLLITAFARLASVYPRLRLAIVGDGTLRQELEDLSRRLNLSAAVRFLGHRLDIAPLHHAFDLFVQSSEYEGTPNAVLEAMAMETPIVATDVGGTRELAWPDRHAIIVPPLDVPALAAGMERALGDPRGMAALAAAARRRIETDLSFIARTHRLEGIYGELIAARRAIAALPAPAASHV
jgi:glycosyltransferase involved in cell wall biosynthesis